MRIALAAALVLLAFAPAPAFAQDVSYPSCLSPDLNDQASLDCATTAAAIADGELTDLYAEIDAREDDGSKVFMRYAQPAFLAYRGSNCAYYGFRGDTAGKVAEQICLVKMTGARIAELEAGLAWARPGKGK